jgi:cytochrome P450
MAQPLPAPPEAGLLNAARFGRQTFRFLEGVQARFDDGTAIPIPGRPPLVVLTSPTLVREALSRPEAFGRVPALDSASLIAENGLVQSDGDLWRQQRSVMQPAFTGEQVDAYGDATGERVARVAEEWETRAPFTGNLHGAMTALTLRVASEILLGEDLGPDRAADFHDWMQTAGREFEFGLDTVSPEWLPERISPEFRDAAANIRALSEELIDRRRRQLAEHEGGDHPANMLTMLLLAEDNPDVEYPEHQIRDEVATFLIAGHETTALSLTYTLSLLSWHPEVRERVRTEAESVLGDDPPTSDAVEDLQLTRRVYDESLRLYPPAWAVFRRTTADVEIGDYTIPEDASVVLPLWSMHRDDRFFDDPETFDPGRWERRDPSEVPAYMPFSMGPHACIGQSFARTGATLSLARLVREFDVDVASNALDDLRVTPTLRPPDGVEATVDLAGE